MADPAGRGQLPRDLADFVGRHHELAVISTLVTATTHGKPAPVVLISGTPGVGKSALALRAAHGVAEHFPDGQLYVDLRGTEPTPRDLLRILLTSVGVEPAAIPDDQAACANLYRARISTTRTLLLIDNATMTKQVEMLLPGGDSCATIITSRSGLHDLPAVDRVNLTSLGAPDAVALLSRIVGEDRASAEPQMVRDIAELCGYLPLALRIAGARLASRPHWTVRRARDRLADERRRLEELRVGDVEVAAAFELSYGMQPTDARELFRLYSLLPPAPFYASTGAFLLNTNRERAEELTELLCEARLIEVVDTGSTGDPRFRFHDLIRLYARKLASAADRMETQTATDGLIEGYWRLVRMPVEPAWFDEEAEILFHCIRQANQTGNWRAVADLSLAVAPLFEVRARWSEWRESAEYTIEAARQLGDTLAEAKSRRSLGRVLRESGSWGPALEQLKHSAELFDQLGERHALADCLRGIGAIHRYRGERDSAEQAFSQSLSISQQADYAAGRAAALRNLGLLMRDLGQCQEAVSFLDEGLTIFRNIQDERGEASSLRNLGIVHTKIGDYTLAEQYFQAALHLYQAMRDPRGEASTMRNLGDCKLAQGEDSSAMVCLQFSLDTFTRLGDLHWRAATLRSVGELLDSRGETEHALETHQQALDGYQDLGDTPRILQVLTKMAGIHERTDRRDTAAEIRKRMACLTDDVSTDGR